MNNYPKIPLAFYRRDGVVQIARELVGKYLFSRINGHICGGKIVETEAYCGRNDRACHAYNGRCTKRTEIMYRSGGVAYVYLCYGIHSLFNVVTNQKDYADAVLIRAIEPVVGVEMMQQRRKILSLSPRLTAGPACLTKALGINCTHTAIDLTASTIWLEERGETSAPIIAAKRIGVDYAGEDANLPWRFYLKDNKWISKY